MAWFDVRHQPPDLKVKDEETEVAQNERKKKDRGSVGQGWWSPPPPHTHTHTPRGELT